MTDPSDNQPVDQLSPAPRKPNNRRTIFLILIFGFLACGAFGILSALLVPNTTAPTSGRRAGSQANQTQVEVTRLVEVEVTRVIETQVEVTRLVEVEVTAPPPPTPTAAPTAEIDPTAYVAGSNITPDDLPQGEPGLNIILTGPPSRFGVVPVVIRNNTDAPVYDIEISATVRDSAGSVLGTGPGRDIAPSYVPPGGVAFGRVLFGDTPLDGTTVDYLVTADDTPGLILSNRDLEIIEHNLVSGNIVGLALNNHDTAVNMLNFSVICFDDDGLPTTVRDSYTDQDRVEAGAELPFSVDLLGDEAQCGRYLLAGGGWRAD